MRVATLCAVLVWLAANASATAAEPDAFTLGPGDHVQLRVSDFRSGMGEAYQWQMFSQQNEEFIVGPDGRLSLPVIGFVDAQGRTAAEVADEVASRLQTRAGLTARPDASIQIVKFRPFYVAGVVDKPGEYEYRPGMTVLQAVSIAGGMQRIAPDLFIGLEKDALSARGDLRALEGDRVSLTARQARIDAETQRSDAITFPKELVESDNPDAARAMREEKLLFDSRRDGVGEQTSALEKNKKFLNGEIDQLRQKSTALARGFDATRQEFDLIANLVKKGLSANSRQLELQQNLAQLQSNQLDVEVAIVRANEDIARSDRDLAEIVSKARNDLMLEAQDVRVKLSETVEKIETARQLVRQAEVHAPTMLQSRLSAAAHPSYRIARIRADGKVGEEPALETDVVKPGDVVRVIINGDDGSPARASAGEASARD